MLFVAVVALVVGFGSSARLASAYGIAVTGTLAIDTILFFVVVRMLWHKPRWLVFGGAAAFLFVDLAFFTANVPKVLARRLVPAAARADRVHDAHHLAARARASSTRAQSEAEGLLRDFVEEVRELDPPVYRAPGTAVFLTAGKETTPLALRENVDHNHVVHQSVVIVSVVTHRVPHVHRSERVVVDELGYEDDGIAHVTVNYGFQDITERAGGAAASDVHRPRMRGRRPHRDVLHLADDDRPRRRAGHGRVAQAPVPRCCRPHRRARSSTSGCPSTGS